MQLRAPYLLRWAGSGPARGENGSRFPASQTAFLTLPNFPALYLDVLRREMMDGVDNKSQLRSHRPNRSRIRFLRRACGCCRRCLFPSHAPPAPWIWFWCWDGDGRHPPVSVPSYCKATCHLPLRASVSPPAAREPHGHPQPRTSPPRTCPQPPLPQGHRVRSPPPRSIQHQTRH